MNDQVAEKVTQIFHIVFNDEAIVLTDDLTANDVEQWDSLNHVNLIVSIENEFNIRFSNNEISNLENVGELLSLIRSKKGLM